MRALLRAYFGTSLIVRLLVCFAAGAVLGINPILDMFETMNNITGDLVCTYAVAHSEKLLGAEPGLGGGAEA